MKNIIAFLGPPGAGKDTQANKLAEEYGLCKFSLGDVLKHQAKTNKYLADVIKSGLLVSDSIINQVIVKELKCTKKNTVLISGFPRTLTQAKYAVEEFAKSNIQLKAVVFLELSPETAIERMSKRLVCPKCGRIYHPKYIPPHLPGICDVDGAKLRKRVEDQPKTILIRLKQYKETIAPVVKLLIKHNLLIKINGDNPPEEVYYDMKKQLIRNNVLNTK